MPVVRLSNEQVGTLFLKCRDEAKAGTFKQAEHEKSAAVAFKRWCEERFNGKFHHSGPSMTFNTEAEMVQFKLGWL